MKQKTNNLTMRAIKSYLMIGAVLLMLLFNKPVRVEAAQNVYTGDQFEYMGVIRYNNFRWTWYSEKVLPGTGLNIPGRYRDEQEFVCDEEDYICLASRDFPKGTVIDTPFGKQGKVYDYCPTRGTIDVYTHF